MLQSKRVIHTSSPQATAQRTPNGNTYIPSSPRLIPIYVVISFWFVLTALQDLSPVLLYLLQAYWYPAFKYSSIYFSLTG
jgi:hypothetical protein